MKEQIKSILGRKLSYYNGFNASSECLYIKQVETFENGFIFRDGCKNGRVIYASNECLAALIASGEHIETGIIDHCSFQKRWVLGKK